MHYRNIKFSIRNHLEFTGCLIIVHYLLIGATYYRHLLLKRYPSANSTNELDAFEENAENYDDAKNNIRRNIKSHIESVVADGLSKYDLLKSLVLYIDSNPNYQDTISRKDQIDCGIKAIENICSIHLSEEDQRVLWI